MPRGRASDDADRRLKGYERKRDFTRTPEPAPSRRPRSGDQPGKGKAAKRARKRSPAKRAPRFVVHEHSATRLHWDLRLEHDGALASWAVPKGLPEAPRENHLAVHTEDHPLEYLDFHGEIPAGEYGAGTMTIWDTGIYEPLKWEPRKVEVALHGRRVDARYALFPIEGGEDAKDWMIHRMDPPADPDVEPMPERVVPMLARAAPLPPDNGRWAYEIKWDGVRAITYSQPGELRLESRNLIDITDRYPELARLNRALSSHRAVLDGEIVAFDSSGRPSFEALQQRLGLSSRAQASRRAKDAPVAYMIFDLLWLDGHSLMNLPYLERRERLDSLALRGPRWQTPEYVIGHGAELLAAAADQRLEGVIAKRIDSTYQPGARTGLWTKIKTSASEELVIGGWTPGKGRRSGGIGALLMGVHDADGSLRYVGRVGSGLSEREIAKHVPRLEEHELDSSPFASGPRPPRDARFTEPRLVAEVEFAEWTASGSLRAPRFKGLRDDKSADDVVREQPAPAVVAAGAPALARSRSASRSRSTRKSASGSRAARSSRASASKRAPRPRSKAASGADLEAPLEIQEKASGKGETTVEGRTLALSNLEKVLYPKPGTTKRDVIEYYAQVAAFQLPHLSGRALTVKRWPDGVDAKFFFQKQAPAHRPDWVRTVTLPSERKPIDYLVADDRATLVWLANLAAIELHVPLALAARHERPTSLVFDLDPGPPADIIACCNVALALQGMFENLGLQSFAKTSGKKGLQVYLPLNTPRVSFADTKTFARAVAQLLESVEPELVVSRMTKSRRAGKVLIDWSQNDVNKTTVAVYSLRATDAPTVSTPLEWDEVRAALDAGDPQTLVFEADAVLSRLAERGDLFAPVLSVVQKLPKLDV